MMDVGPSLNRSGRPRPELLIGWASSHGQDTNDLIRNGQLGSSQNLPGQAEGELSLRSGCGVVPRVRGVALVWLCRL